MFLFFLYHIYICNYCWFYEKEVLFMLFFARFKHIKMKTKKALVCPNCWGLGIVTDEDGNTALCVACNGTGKIYN